MQKNNKKFSIVHPFLLSLFPVLFIYSQNVYELSVQEIILPVLLILFASVLLWILVRFIIKNNEKSSFIISLLLVLSFTYGHIYLLIDDFTLGNSDIGRHQYLLIPFAISFIVGTYYFVKTKRRLNNASTISSAITGTFIVIILINIATYNIGNVDSFDSELITTETSLATYDATAGTFTPHQDEIRNYPDVYYIILDGYMSSSSLKEFLNYDNQEFVSYLSNKGFNVNHKSYANYPGSIPSVTSTLNMTYLNFLTEEQVKHIKIPQKMYVENTVMQNFKSAGYKIINIQRPFPFIVSSSLFDSVMCERNKYVDSQLFNMTIKTSILVFLLEKWEERELREATLCNFAELSKQDQKFDEPIFVFSHILVPHPPYLFGPEGESVSSVRPQGLESWQNEEGYINSIKFANKEIMQVVDGLLADPENSPVIIIQADHGYGFDVDASKLSKENLEQRMSILSAYYLPGIEENLSDDVITPVNTFRIIFNSYFNADYDLLENKMYLDDNDGGYVDVTNILTSP
ncbi:MAG: sulfatase-like hydrolase/transferase [Pelagibacterales bacterium]|nr:sulfatase-like hydrolase/transferase [Pelagibacterales bacterium]